MSYYLTKVLQTPFDSAVRQLVEGLKGFGYGVFADIDVQSVLKQKLGADMPKTRILGTNKPEVGHKLLTTDHRIGALLPFSIIVRELSDSSAEVVMVDPVELLKPVDQAEVAAVAAEVKHVFAGVLEGL